MQRKRFSPALIMIVREHASPDARKRGVAAEEPMGKPIDEIHQTVKSALIYVHGRMFAVYRDPVLIKVTVRRKLPKPFLPAEVERYGAQRARASAE